MSQLSLDKPIWGIDAVKNLQTGHPVFLIVGYDGSHLVVKKESTLDRDNLRRNQLSMQLATPQARSVVLTNPEVFELGQAVSHAKVNAIIYRGAVSQDVTDLERYLATPGTWFKMKEIKGLFNLAGAAKDLQDGDKSGVRAMAKALNNSGGLEALGKIVGADMFNHNGDRFTWKGAGVVWIGAQKLELNALVNPGNVMGALSGGQLTMIGLDSWDPNGIAQADMGKDVDTSEWLGAILAPAERNAREEFAKQIAADLETVLGPRNRRFEFLQQTRLNPDAPKRIVKGMESITKKLIAKLEDSQKRVGAPAGIASRLKVLRGV